MQPPVSARANESSVRPQTSNCETACPLCAGPVVEVRSLRRCLRCSFTTCVGCGGGTADLIVEHD